MKIFISWSGDTSKQVALTMRDWLPAVIQEVEPWVSSEDIEKGSQWTAELTKELTDTKEGIVCVTADNSDRSWLAFEAGVLSKTTGQTKVRTALFGVTPADISGPLSTFQHTLLGERDDVKKFVDSINRSCQNPLRDQLLSRSFDREWPDLQQELSRISQPTLAIPAVAPRTTEDILTEILGLVRGITQIGSLEEGIQEILGKLNSRTALPTGLGEELRLVHGLVSSLVQQGVVSDLELSGLISMETRPPHDKWVQALRDANPRKDGDPWDEPSPSASGGYSDEPPF